MKIVIACGGTGGHAFPGLATACELARRGHDVTVWTSGRDAESGALADWTGPVFRTFARPLALRNAFAVLRSILRCRREMRRARPDALLAMGSYASLPPVLAARSAGVRVFLHEANTVPGKAVDFLSRLADAVAISFASTAKWLPGARTLLTGLPVRAGIAAGARFPFVPPDAFTVFVTGGSQGAHAVNALLSAALVMLAKDLDARRARGEAARRLYVVHQTGARDEGAVRAAYAAAGIPARVCAFERDMADAFATADVVVARAGASTCFELAACGKPAFLIPLPTALRDHQRLNAEAFAAAGAADAGVEAKLSPRAVARHLLGLHDHPERLAKMAERMRARATPDAAAKLADLVEKGAPTGDGRLA